MLGAPGVLAVSFMKRRLMLFLVMRVDGFDVWRENRLQETENELEPEALPFEIYVVYNSQPEHL
jgi:hypothetical protein